MWNIRGELSKFCCFLKKSWRNLRLVWSRYTADAKGALWRLFVLLVGQKYIYNTKKPPAFQQVASHPFLSLNFLCCCLNKFSITELNRVNSLILCDCWVHNILDFFFNLSLISIFFRINFHFKMFNASI